jgi:hypothetical protein
MRLALGRCLGATEQELSSAFVREGAVDCLPTDI